MTLIRHYTIKNIDYFGRFALGTLTILWHAYKNGIRLVAHFDVFVKIATVILYGSLETIETKPI